MGYLADQCGLGERRGGGARLTAADNGGLFRIVRRACVRFVTLKNNDPLEGGCQSLVVVFSFPRGTYADNNDRGIRSPPPPAPCYGVLVVLGRSFLTRHDWAEGGTGGT